MTRQRLEELAEEHGLEIEEEHRVGAYTPSSVAARAVAASGPIAAGHTGALALALRGSGAVVNVHLPASIARLPQLLCRDASWRLTREYRLDTTGLERLDHETVFESMSVERRFAVEHPADADPILLRRLFSPTFLDWLGDRSPEDLHFELHNGRLAVFLAEAPGKKDLEILWEAAARITARIAGELAESRRPGDAAAFAEPLPPPPEDEVTRAAMAQVAKVKWAEPPADVRTAAAAYARHAGGGPGHFLRAFTLAGGIALVFVVAAGIAVALDAILAAIALLILAGMVFVTIFPLALRNPRARRAAELGKLAFAEEVATAEGLDLEDPTAWHSRYPDLELPGPVRRLWRGTTRDGRTFRLALVNDAAATGERSGYEALFTEAGAGPRPVLEGAETIAGGGVSALVRSTPLGSGPTLAGLRELRAAAG